MHVMLMLDVQIYIHAVFFLFWSLYDICECRDPCYAQKPHPLAVQAANQKKALLNRKEEKKAETTDELRTWLV